MVDHGGSDQDAAHAGLDVVVLRCETLQLFWLLVQQVLLSFDEAGHWSACIVTIETCMSGVIIYLHSCMSRVRFFCCRGPMSKVHSARRQGCHDLDVRVPGLPKSTSGP